MQTGRLLGRQGSCLALAAACCSLSFAVSTHHDGLMPHMHSRLVPCNQHMQQSAAICKTSPTCCCRCLCWASRMLWIGPETLHSNNIDMWGRQTAGATLHESKCNPTDCRGDKAVHKSIHKPSVAVLPGHADHKSMEMHASPN